MTPPKKTRQELHEPLTLGQRAADKVAATVGSWRFIILQNSFLFLWAFLNLVGWSVHWDPYPFILMNLVLSWQAGNTGSVLQMSDNRRAEKDRARDDLEAEEVALILSSMGLLVETVQLLKTVNEQQLEILNELRSR